MQAEVKHRNQAKVIRQLYNGLNVNIEEVAKLFDIIPPKDKQFLAMHIADSLGLEYSKGSTPESQVRICCAVILESLQKHNKER